MLIKHLEMRYLIFKASTFLMETVKTHCAPVTYLSRFLRSFIPNMKSVQIIKPTGTAGGGAAGWDNGFLIKRYCPITLQRPYRNIRQGGM